MSNSALVVGAGSIGAHLSRSLAKAGWMVDVVDISQEAVNRFTSTLFPSRYGQLPPNIKIHGDETRLPASFDGIFVGTPPDTHLPVIERWLPRASRFVSVQKPLTTYRKSEIRQLENLARNTLFFSGFNHRVSIGATAFFSLIRDKFVDVPVVIKVNWKESWDGIMAAHPWLAGPADSYLGHLNRGGGALFEHSHGIDLGLLVGDVLGLGPITSLSSKAALSGNSERSLYDSEIEVSATFQNNSTLQVKQDVITWPAEKSISVQSDDWLITLRPGPREQLSLVSSDAKVSLESTLEKSREEDFDAEIREITRSLRENHAPSSPLSFEAALRTAKVSSFVASQFASLDLDIYSKADLISEGLFIEN